MIRRTLRATVLYKTVLSTIVLIAAGSLGAPATLAEESSWVFELRTYTTHDGKLDALHDRFRNHTVELFESHGMKNIAYWVPEGQDNTLVYLLAHPSVDARNKAFKAFAADPKWKKAFQDSRQDGPLVAKVESLMLTATDYSPNKEPEALMKPEPGLVYELRTYTTEKGRLPNLNARFRDHTMKIFEKHGMFNYVYTTPLKEDLRENTLVYLIAHKDRKAADASWSAFGKDPQWREVAAASQRDGRILVRGGVKRQYLNLMDYSPVQ